MSWANVFDKFNISKAGIATRRGGPAGPTVPAFWTMAPTSSVTLTLTLKTSDSQPITMDWGDGTVESLTHDVAKAHTYSAGSYVMRIHTPERVTYLSDSGLVRTLPGTVDCQYLCNCTDFRLRRHGITAISNINAMSGLTYLDCYSNQLTSLAVSTNTALTHLDCGGNQLTSLAVNTHTALTYLSCYSNQLTSLDVSANTALTSLNCYGNQLTSLDVSANTLLVLLTCATNSLTALDVSANTALENLRCDSNQLTALNVSSNTALTVLYCTDNASLTTIAGATSFGQAVVNPDIRVSYCALTATTIDELLAACVAGGRTGGYLEYKWQTGDSQTDESRSAQGLLDISTLEYRSWIVSRTW